MPISDESKNLLNGAVDIHVHTSPDVFERKLDDIEAAEQAQRAGLKGLMLKNHIFPTVDRALLASKKTGFNVMGSITLNKGVGGLNPYAVETAVKMGAKIVWMPTVHSVNTVEHPNIFTMFQKAIGPNDVGLSVLESGEVASSVYTILEILKERNVALATGHIYPNEAIELVRAAVDMKLQKIILTHPFSSLVGMTVDQVKELTELSENIFVEFTCFDCSKLIKNPISIEQMVTYISEIGPQKVFISSDGGQPKNPYPVEILLNMIEDLLPHFEAATLKTMFAENPSSLVTN